VPLIVTSTGDEVDDVGELLAQRMQRIDVTSQGFASHLNGHGRPTHHVNSCRNAYQSKFLREFAKSVANIGGREELAHTLANSEASRKTPWRTKALGTSDSSTP
jgi:hypothetical protein